MRWAVAFHPEQVQTLPNGRCRLTRPPLQIAEHCIGAARDQGWIVLGTDTDVMVTADVPLQSNPRRSVDGEDV